MTFKLKSGLLPLMVVLSGLLSSFGVFGDAQLMNEAQPYENLTVSGQPSLEQLQALADEGYTTIINLRREGEFDDFDEAAVISDLGMNYVQIPLDNIGSITESDAKALNLAISSASGPVLLHCASGGRAGGLLGIERYLFHGASEDEAIEIAIEANTPRAGKGVEKWLEAQE